MVSFRRLGPVLDALPYRHAARLRVLFAKPPTERGRGFLLDVGGGTGRVSAHLADSYRVVVVDVEASLLKRASKRGLDVIRADARHLPIKDAAAEAFLVTDALHHMRDVAKVFAETARVLEPERGRAVIEEFDPATRRGAVVAQLEGFLRMDSVFYAPGFLLDSARGAGLSARVERLSRRDYALIARREADAP